MAKIFDIETLSQILRERAPQPASTIAEMRATAETSAATIRLPVGVEVVAARVGGVATEWIRPAGVDDRSMIIHLHGGGYVMGSLATVRQLASNIAVAANTSVLSVDYRLAPEHPHPAAVDDVVMVYRALLNGGREPASVVISGDSAGGGLAVASTVALRDAGDPLPAGVVCFSPWSDLTMSGQTLTTNAATDPILPPWLLARMAASYIGSADAHSPLISPAWADLRHLPPILIHVGGAEVLLDDARQLAAAAAASGVVVELDCWPGMFHVWHAFAPGLAEGTAAIERAGQWIRMRFESCPTART
jgi:monoterpene epsilon-lactone hydrolase